ncbi:MAG: cardiolipin synthase [Verrucomicrobiales bacterium]|nr:cardiolipin synthase [Verrucomicrobiales bacterium]
MVSFFVTHISSILAVSHVLISVGISIRVIMRRTATGVALAWLFLVSVFPFGGAVMYLMLGERRISATRVRRISTRQTDYEKLVERGIARGLADVDWSRHRPAARAMNILGKTTVGVPTVHGSSGKLFSKTDQILDGITADIENAQNSILMEFYIWNEGGKADEVLDAVIRAAQRGVSCRILIDALGGARWWRSRQPQKLREAGVEVCQALPVGILRNLIDRTDLRVHRKIVVIDSKIAWTGSMNLVDPKFFKQEKNLGEWVDAMVRLEGAVVAPLALTMIGDWTTETGESLDDIVPNLRLDRITASGPADIQVVPSGPGETKDGLLQMLIATINSAEKELVLTTPYFVPDESILCALRAAAARGVRVDLIVPEKVDSILTRFAGRSYYDDLMEVGANIYLYKKGLLHTKSISSDRDISMIGTVNLDMRSLWINYEVALFIYDENFGKSLFDLQQSYIRDSDLLEPEQWAGRSALRKFLENTFRLVSLIL